MLDVRTISVQEAVTEYFHATLRLSPDTRRNKKLRLLLFADWCDQHNVTLETLTARHIRAFLEEVSKRAGKKSDQVKTSTVKAYTITVKAFVNWCACDEYESIISSKVASRVEIPKVEETVIEVFTPEQIEALFEATEKQSYAVRDKALLAVLLDTGARANEVAGLTLPCVWLDADDSYIKVMGKGRKEREIPLGRTARTALRRYITRYRKAKCKAEQHVFLAGKTGKPLTRSGVFQIVAEIGRKAHIKGVRCSPHSFRHTFACLYLLNGGDVYKLSRLMGHTEVSITERYLRAIKSKQVRQENHSVLDRLKSQ